MPVDSSRLPRSKPELSGIPSSAITRFLEAADSIGLGLHTFMLLRHGNVVAETAWSPYKLDSRHWMFSVSKSFTSTAVGFAVSEGLLSVEDLVVSYFPDKHILDDINLKKMRIKHLLCMSAGHARKIMVAMRERQDGDWVQAFLETPVEHEPGTHFLYDNGPTYMLSAILQRLTGITIHEYLQPRLFIRLGIEGSTWETCPRGICIGAWGLVLKVEDLAVFGQMYLQKGIWQGMRILDEDWAQTATSFQIAIEKSNDNDLKYGYGYQFAIAQDGSYRAVGAYGQFCVVLPEQDAVVAITAGTSQINKVVQLVREHIVPQIVESSLPADGKEYGILTDKMASLTYPPLHSDVDSPIKEQISGKQYLIQDNEHGLQTATFQFEARECLVTIRDHHGVMQFRCGMGHWVGGDANSAQSGAYMASGMWENTDTLVMSWRFVETPYIHKMSCHFEKNRLSMVAVFGMNDPITLVGEWDLAGIHSNLP